MGRFPGARGARVLTAGRSCTAAPAVFWTEPKRLRKLLSGLINFAKFREMQMGTVDMLLVEREQMMQQHSEIMEVNVQLDQRLGEIEAARQKDAPIAAALEAECNELSAEINKRNEAQVCCCPGRLPAGCTGTRRPRLHPAPTRAPLSPTRPPPVPPYRDPDMPVFGLLCAARQPCKPSSGKRATS